MPISKSKKDELARFMKGLGISEDDLTEKFVRSSGSGGQNVNKVSTCVILKHLPTGIIVKCQKERTQGQNRFLARRRLAEKIETLKLGRKSAAEQRIWKLRKQKQRRSKKAKEKVLDEKRKQSEKKKRRVAPKVSYD